MGIGTMSLLASLLAALGYAGGGGIASINKNAKNSNNPNTKYKYSGWANQMYGNSESTSNSDLGRWFRSRANPQFSEYLNAMSDAELGSILDQYYDNKGGWFGNNTYEFNLNSANADLARLAGMNMNMPEAPDWDAINKEAEDKINLENSQILGLYDQNLARQKQLYNQGMQNNNQMYNDYTRQILSNDYQKNAQLMGGLGNSLDRARSSALEAGASAGLRLSNNINTLLSTQNKQAQQSMDTANNLAQAMLNQRQAAESMRNTYNSALMNDTNARANLINGSTERKTAYQNTLTNNYLNTYNNKMNSWENSNSQYSSNPFYGSYMAHNQNKYYNNGGKQ
jgi:hypothetical protein